MRLTTLITSLLLTTAIPSAHSSSILRELSNGFSAIYESASPAVVFIEVEAQPPVQGGEFSPFAPQQDPFDSFERDFFERFFGTPHHRRGTRQPAPQKSQGSGFVIGKDGFIVTNNHVVRDATSMTVKFKNGDKYDARLIGADADTDVALIKIEATNLPTLEFADSEEIRVGDLALAIGAPFQLAGTMTHGIISAKQRDNLNITSYEDFIQTNADVNPGNSGGPLIDINGRVIGINTAIYSRSGASNGISFAIPSNMAKYVIAQLKDCGKVNRSYFGVIMKPVDQDVMDSLNLKSRHGALICQVMESSPADTAGLKSGDIIIKYDGKLIDPDKLGTFRNEISMRKPGAKVALTILRNNQMMNINVILSSINDHKESDEGLLQTLGMSVIDMESELYDRHRIPTEFQGKELKGVLVNKVNYEGKALAAGIQPGMLILSVNHTETPDINAFNKALKKEKKKKCLLFQIYYKEKTFFITIRKDR